MAAGENQQCTVHICCANSLESPLCMFLYSNGIATLMSLISTTNSSTAFSIHQIAITSLHQMNILNKLSPVRREKFAQEFLKLWPSKSCFILNSREFSLVPSPESHSRCAVGAKQHLAEHMPSDMGKCCAKKRHGSCHTRHPKLNKNLLKVSDLITIQALHLLR